MLKQRRNPRLWPLWKWPIFTSKKTNYANNKVAICWCIFINCLRLNVKDFKELKKCQADIKDIYGCK